MTKMERGCQVIIFLSGMKKRKKKQRIRSVGVAL